MIQSFEFSIGFPSAKYQVYFMIPLSKQIFPFSSSFGYLPEKALILTPCILNITLGSTDKQFLQKKMCFYIACYSSSLLKICTYVNYM